jgi:competence protein ComEC
MPSRAYFAYGLVQAQQSDPAMLAARQAFGDQAVAELRAADVLVVSRHLRVTVLLPLRPVSVGDNDESLVLCLEYDAEADGVVDARVLLTGDAEAHVLRQLGLEYPGMGFDLVKVPHHGSRRALSADLLEAWGCRAGLISVGANSYGHPTAEALDMLHAQGAYVLRTDELGDIRVRFRPGGLEISYSGMHPFWSL